MAEVFAEYGTVAADDGREFVPRVCGAQLDHIWQGWIEFVAAKSGKTVRTERETTQPNRTDLAYWAAGLTPTYLEGALDRALRPPTAREHVKPVALYDEPAPHLAASSPTPLPTESVLNPFSVYQKGERLLRRQLGALAPWHLVNIIRAFDLSDAEAATLEKSSAQVLIDLIVTSVRAQSHATPKRSA